MKFYLNNVEVQVEVAPTITETLDETLDSASVVLKANSQRLPYAPMQDFRIDFENNTDILHFLVQSDSVEIYSIDPLSYKHTLTLIQNTRKLSKHIVRNSVFTQPANKYKKSYWATTTNAHNQGITTLSGLGGSYYSENLTSKEKVLNTYIELQLSCAFQTSGLRFAFESINSIDDLNTRCGATASIYFEANPITINYTLNGVATTYTLTNADVEGGEIVFNKKLKCNKIKELLESGATNIYISATNGFVGAEGDITQLTTYPHYLNSRANTQIETYYYTCYDILDLLLKRQKRKSLYRDYNALFTLPSSDTDLYALLTHTIAPNFAFTQCTLYECVAEIFRLFDAIFTLDGNNVLGIEYFNDNDKPVILETNKKLAGLNISISEDRYTNKIITYYQDARQTRTFPSENRVANVRSLSLGVPEANDHAFIVDKPIYTIEKAEVIIDSIGFGRSSITTTMAGSFPVDITDYVKEESIWTLLPITTTDTIQNYVDSSSFLQASSIHYARGSTYIPLADETRRGVINYPNFTTLLHYVARRFLGMSDRLTFATTFGDKFEVNDLDGNDTPSWKDLKFRITYTTTIDGRSVVESIEKKLEGDTLINQNNGAVDLNKMGLNMLGVSLKSGEPSMSATMQLSSWANRLKKDTIYQDTLGNKWVVNVANYTLFDNCIKASYSLVKNYNELSKRIRIENEKRLSNVSSELTQKSEDNIIDFVYYSSDSADFSNYDNDTYLTYENLFNVIETTFSNGTYDNEMQYAVVRTFSNNAIIENAYIPLVKYALGNCLCFEMSFDSPISAGNKTKVQSGWFGNDKYNTTSVKYTDNDGFFDKVDIAFYNTSTVQTFSDDFPAMTQPSGFDIYKLEIYKQPNEVFALNYELAFLPVNTQRDFIGQQFMQNNNFVIAKANCNKAYRVYYANDDFKYSVLDTKAHGTNYFVPTISIENDEDKKLVSITLTNASSIVAKNWALTDSDGNIYFASNSEVNSDNVSIYFQTRIERI